MERAGAINEFALVEFSRGRFLPEQRQDVARWLIEPTLKISLATCGGLIICNLLNIAIVLFVMIRRNAAGASSDERQPSL
jgi:hypothetical protein